MVEETLVNEGRLVVRTLHDQGIPLEFAVWFADPSSEGMRLAIGSHSIDQIGPTAAYQQIAATVESIKDQIRLFRLDLLKLVSVESQIGRALLRSFGNKTGDSIVGMYVSPEVVLQQVFAYGTA
ncbi:MAG: hypothetical protein V2A73_09890 [Pseudomonadota bacterium]